MFKFSRIFTRVVHRHRSLYAYLFQWLGKDILIDSSKSPGWVRRQLRHQHHWQQIEPIIIYVVRDGRAVVNSFLRKYPERGATAVIEDWMRRVSELNEFYTSSPHTKQMVHYEEFCLNPEKVTQELCNTIGIGYDAVMLEFWKHDHHVVGGNAGTQSMITKFREKIGDGAAIQAGEWHDGYYDHEPMIKLDLRWKDELSAENLALFEEMTGNLNRQFQYE